MKIGIKMTILLTHKHDFEKHLKSTCTKEQKVENYTIYFWLALNLPF